MFEIVAYSLGGALALIMVIACSLAAWRLIPRSATTQDSISAHERLDHLEVLLASMADQFQLSVNRNHAVIGKLRRKLARELGEEEEDEEEAPPAPPAPVLPLPVGKDALRRTARERGQL